MKKQPHFDTVAASWMLIGMVAAAPKLLAHAERLPNASLPPLACELWESLQNRNRKRFAETMEWLTGTDAPVTIDTLVEMIGEQFWSEKIRKAQVRISYAPECELTAYLGQLQVLIDGRDKFRQRTTTQSEDPCRQS